MPKILFGFQEILEDERKRIIVYLLWTSFWSSRKVGVLFRFEIPAELVYSLSGNWHAGGQLARKEKKHTTTIGLGRKSALDGVAKLEKFPPSDSLEERAGV